MSSTANKTATWMIKGVVGPAMGAFRGPRQSLNTLKQAASEVEEGIAQMARKSAAMSGSSEERPDKEVETAKKVREQVEQWLAEPQIITATCLVFLAGVHYRWQPALCRWGEFTRRTHEAICQATTPSGPSGLVVDRDTVSTWLEERVKTLVGSASPPSGNWLEEAFRASFTHFGSTAPDTLPDWVTMILHPEYPLEVAGDEDDEDTEGDGDGEEDGEAGTEGFFDEQCQCHPGLRAALAKLKLEHRYQLVDRYLTQRPRAELAADGDVTDEGIDARLRRLRTRIVNMLAHLPPAIRPRVSKKWVERLLPQPRHYVPSWEMTKETTKGEKGREILEARAEGIPANEIPNYVKRKHCREEWSEQNGEMRDVYPMVVSPKRVDRFLKPGYFSVGLFAWTMPCQKQLDDFRHEECQGNVALDEILKELGRHRVPLKQDVADAFKDNLETDSQSEADKMTALEFLYALYRSRFPGDKKLGLAVELHDAGFEYVGQGSASCSVTRKHIDAVFREVRGKVAGLIDNARKEMEVGKRLMVSESWKNCTLPNPDGRLFPPLPTPRQEASS